MFNKLRTVIYHATDLEKAKIFYQTILGFAPYFDEPFYVGFEINGCELGLDPDMTNVQTGNHQVAYWSVNDIQIAVNKILAIANTKLIEPINNVGGTIEVAVVEDPFGNYIGLIAGA
jgi:predicted enzyme related to lactoylglutathione lyase